jgi:hypothetical protein
MTTLLINDLPLSEELGSKEMTAVRGGMGYKFAPYKWGDFDMSKDLTFKADNDIVQKQDFAATVGNQVAVLGGSFKPNVHIHGNQDADIDNRVRN